MLYKTTHHRRINQFHVASHRAAAFHQLYSSSTLVISQKRRKFSPIPRRPLHKGNKQVYKNNSIKPTRCDKQNQRFLSQMGFQNKQISNKLYNLH
jgi:hypothetical protein